jgi:16S rRNA (cytosine1402-N4)-methyltransferase
MYTHTPVLINEVLNGLYIPDDAIVIDGTIGLGGHAYQILNKNKTIKSYYAFDVDSSAIKIAEEKLEKFPCVHFINKNYSEAVEILKDQGINSADTILLDLGVSSMQLDNPQRGFSFRFDAPLSMRLDGANTDTVAEYINTVDENELIEVLKELGEEDYAYKITKKIIESREIKPITTTFELRDIVYNAYPMHKRFGRIHPATKTFQALRIAINGELSHLKKALDELSQFLSPHGRMLVISFHSLEDRIVKQAFKNLEQTQEFKLVTKKPIIPTDTEIQENPRSRTSKMRIIEKTS